MTDTEGERPQSTADICDEAGDRAQSCETPLLQYGRRRHFSGPASTVRCRDDSVLIKQALSDPGDGRVLVVDGAGSLRHALLGETWAGTALHNGWSGVVIHGAVRDVAELAGIDFGVKALGSNPRRSLREGTGERDVPVIFGGTTFRPGDLVVCDDDGVVTVR